MTKNTFLIRYKLIVFFFFETIVSVESSEVCLLFPLFSHMISQKSTPIGKTKACSKTGDALIDPTSKMHKIAKAPGSGEESPPPPKQGPVVSDL